MSDTLRRFAILALPLVLAAGCDSDVDDAMEEAATEEALDSILDETPQGMAPVGTQEGGVLVTLEEWAIRLPDTLPPGSYTFQVTNAGTVEHAFEIEGSDNEWVTERIPPGGTATLTAELSAGTYTVYCPVTTDAGEHAELGMRTTLIVR